MQRNLPRAYCAPASGLPARTARKRAEPPAKRHALAERPRVQRRTTHRTDRRRFGRRANAGGRRR